jgi:hypothetical protein
MQALIVGSESAVSVVTTCTIFPATDNDNKIQGFVWLKGGFELEDETTSCTFDGVYPISGTVDLNGGTLYLLQDMVLANPTQLNGLGTIIGNGHSIEFCESVTALPANLKTIKDLNVFFDGDIEMLGGLTVQGNCLINCTGNVMRIGDNVTVKIDENSTLELQDATLKNVNNNIGCVSDTSHLIIQDIVACLEGDSHFIHGDMTVQNNCKITGPYTFWYDTTQPCFIDYEATLRLDGGMTLKTGRKTIGGIEPIKFYDASSKLIADECTLHITATGIALTRGRLEMEKNVLIESESTVTTYGIILGDGISAENDVIVYLGGGSLTTFASPLVYNNVQPDRFYSAGPSACFYRKLTSPFYVAKTCVHPVSHVIFEVVDMQFAPTILADGVSVYFNNMDTVVPGINETTYYASRTNDYLCLLNNGAFIYLTSGIFTDPIWVSDKNNMISGNGTFSGAITLLDHNSQLLLNLVGEVRNTISLNGGTIKLYSDIFMSSHPCFSSSGIVDLDSHTMYFNYAENINTRANAFDCSLTLSGDNGFLNMSDNTTLTTTWTIQGLVTIDGNGNAFNLVNGGKLVIASGAHLTLRNMRVNLIGQGDIICVDNTSKVTLDDIHWVQNEDFTFYTGALEFKNSVIMSGQRHVFTYKSTQESFIDYDSTLELDYQFTFSYAPINSAETLLQCQDFSSRLSFNYATLYITSGLTVLKGKMIITGDSVIYALGNGLTLGDQTSGNDTQLIFNGASRLTFEQGSFAYKNVKSDSLQLNSSNISFNSTRFNAYENIDLGNGSISFGVNSIYAHVAGKSITGSIFGWYTEEII